MDQRIIYQVPGGAAAIITPIEASGLTVQQVGDKDVPQGLSYWIVSSAEVNALYAQFGDYRNAWEVNATTMGRQRDGLGAPK